MPSILERKDKKKTQEVNIALTKAHGPPEAGGKENI